MQKQKGVVGIALVLLVVAALVVVAYIWNGNSKFCGGIAGLECPLGFSCQLEGNYPDVGGKCMFMRAQSPVTPTGELAACVQDSDCVLGHPKLCEDACSPCLNLDANEDSVIAINGELCSRLRPDIPEGTLCTQCITAMTNFEKYEAKCINNRCVKVVK